MGWNDDLLGTHLNIAAYPDSPLRVIAGPGTGKTFALMRRVQRLLEAGVNPQGILAVTFTRTAAKDLIDKLAALQVPGAQKVRACTLHSLSFAILHDNANFEATGRHARPLLKHEENILICDLKEEFGGKRKVTALIEAFNAYWARLQSDEPGWPNNPIERQFHNTLVKWLRRHQAMLIGEVIPMTLDFIRNNPESPSIPQFSHILVDEYQDLNRADQALIDALSTNTTEVTVVGDEDQSIYSFRHAHPAGIAFYHETHPNTHDEVLEKCRRCPETVIAMATSLIQNNRRVRTTTLEAMSNSTQGTVYIVQHYSVDDEAENLARFIDWYLINNPDTDPGQVLVLTTRKAFGERIRDRLIATATDRNRNWQAQSFFTEECLSTIISQEGFTLLALHVNPTDLVSLRTWLGLGTEDGRAPAYERLLAYADANNLSPYQVLDGLIKGDIKMPHMTHLVARYSNMLEKLEGIRSLKGEELINALFPFEGGECEEIRVIAAQALLQAKNVDELLEEIRTLVTSPELPDDHSQIVRVMTLYKSKGLTAKVVIIAGCVAGALPSYDSDKTPAEQENMEEEQRRLFYVALTRTTDTLVISSAVRMPRRAALSMRLPVDQYIGGDAILKASPFLSQLGPSRPSSIAGSAWRQKLGF